MKFKLLIVLLFISFLVGCMSDENVTPFKDFTFSYEMISIEDEDNKEVQKWLNEPDQTPTRIYEVNDDNNSRHYIYGHSSKYSDVKVETENKAIILTFKTVKIDSSEQDALVKIKYNPNKIETVAVKTE